MSTSTVAESDGTERWGLDRREARARARLGAVGSVRQVSLRFSGRPGVESIVPYVGPPVRLLGRRVGYLALEPRPRGPRSRRGALGVLLGLFVMPSRGASWSAGLLEPGDGGDAADGLRGMVRGRTVGVARDLGRRELLRGVDASACTGVRSGLQHRDGPDPGDLRCLRRWLGGAAPAKGHGGHGPVGGRLRVWTDRVRHLTVNDEAITNARERARSPQARGPRVTHALHHAALEAELLGRGAS